MNTVFINNQNNKFFLFASIGLIVLAVFFLSCSSGESDLEKDYQWPAKTRDYWPTTDWQTAPMAEHGINESKIKYAAAKGASIGIDAIVVVKDGYIVFEKYYTGDQNTSTELWSATKSIASTLAGIAITKGYINNVNQLMTDYIPEHDFRDIRIVHVLTQRTGLVWDDGNGSYWAAYTRSSDWTAHALAKGRISSPGTTFLYSSANSHFLSHLVASATGMATGDFANQYLFQPLGINFSRLLAPVDFSDYPVTYMIPLGRTTWQQDVQEYEIGGIGLYLTAREMAKIGFLYINKGIWDGQVILSESYIDEATRPYNLDSYYGYQWWISASSHYLYFSAGGSGGQRIMVVPSLDMVIAIKCKPYAAYENRVKNDSLISQTEAEFIEAAR